MRLVKIGEHSNVQDFTSRLDDIGTALAGSAVISVLAVPSLAAEAMKNIPFAVLIGFAAAMPLSYLVARKLGASATR